MRTIKLNEIIPEHLYQRGQFITFPWSAKMEMLEQYKITMVVNLWTRPDPELHTYPGLVYIHWPIGGGEPPKPYSRTGYLMDLVHNEMYEGRVLVHCEAGVNRSIWLAAKLYARWYEVPGLEALKIVEARANRIKVRDGLVTDLVASDDHS